MASPTKGRTRRPRGSIDADMILEGAFEVARRDGLESMSMPELAAHLEVGVTSIYWYFRNKEDLLQQMHAQASRAIEERMVRPGDFPTEQWREHLFQLFHQLRAAYAEDDVFAELMLHRRTGQGERTPQVYANVEAVLAHMVDAGFPLVAAWDVYAALWMFTHNVATLERARRKTGFPPEGPAQLSLLDVASMPLLTKLVLEEGVILNFTGDTFTHGIDLILDAAAAKRS